MKNIVNYVIHKGEIEMKKYLNGLIHGLCIAFGCVAWYLVLF